MTVIAYKDGVMACDSLCSDVNTGAIWWKGTKIYRMKSGALVGASGAADARAVLALLQNVKRGNQLPTARELADTHTETENGILVALPNGEVWAIVIIQNGGHWEADCCPMPHGFAAAGCGAREALVAMKCGKSAREAVALACQFNAFCRPPIYTEELHPVKSSRQSAPAGAKPVLKVITGGLSQARGSRGRRARRTGVCRKRG